MREREQLGIGKIGLVGGSEAQDDVVDDDGRISNVVDRGWWTLIPGFPSRPSLFSQV